MTGCCPTRRHCRNGSRPHRLRLRLERRSALRRGAPACRTAAISRARRACRSARRLGGTSPRNDAAGRGLHRRCRAWPHPVLRTPARRLPLCVAAGAILGAHQVPLETALAAWLQAFSMNLVQAGIASASPASRAPWPSSPRSSPFSSIPRGAPKSSLDDLGSVTVLSDIAAMKHEMQHSRLFRS